MVPQVPLTPQVHPTALQAPSSLSHLRKSAKEPLAPAALLLALHEVTHREVGTPQNGDANDEFAR